MKINIATAAAQFRTVGIPTGVARISATRICLRTSGTENSTLSSGYRRLRSSIGLQTRATMIDMLETTAVLSFLTSSIGANGRGRLLREDITNSMTVFCSGST
jgi:hypothetical protein